MLFHLYGVQTISSGEQCIDTIAAAQAVALTRAFIICENKKAFESDRMEWLLIACRALVTNKLSRHNRQNIVEHSNAGIYERKLSKGGNVEILPSSSDSSSRF